MCLSFFKIASDAFKCLSSWFRVFREPQVFGVLKEKGVSSVCQVFQESLALLALEAARYTVKYKYKYKVKTKRYYSTKKKMRICFLTV